MLRSTAREYTGDSDGHRLRTRRYFPRFFDGENVRVGRYVSIPDIEAQLAPNNLTYSHSLLYTYDPYTQNGIVSTTMLSKNWKVQLEISVGNDISATDKSFRQLTPAAYVMYTTNSARDAFYPCMNGLNGEAVLVAMFPPPEYNIGAPAGAQCNNVALVYCASHEWAVVNYVNYQHDLHDIWSWRSDYLNDSTGQRTGFKGAFAEFDLSYTHWIGGKRSQAMLAMDAIFHF